MHRALGGAPTSRVHRAPSLGLGVTWRSLGRSLRANAMRVRRGLASGKAKLKNSVPAAASSLQPELHLKNKIF